MAALRLKDLLQVLPHAPLRYLPRPLERQAPSLVWAAINPEKTYKCIVLSLLRHLRPPQS